MARQTITEAPGLTPPLGPYARAAWASAPLLFVSGQTGVDPATGALPPGGDVATETAQVLRNLGAVLAAAGLGFEDVVKVNVYLTDMSAFAAMNEVYARAFSAPLPARTTIGVSALPGGARVEMELTACARTAGGDDRA